jgi:hypothetical protein
MLLRVNLEDAITGCCTALMNMILLEMCTTIDPYFCEVSGNGVPSLVLSMRRSLYRGHQDALCIGILMLKTVMRAVGFGN